jgi:hypothetical protein
VRGRFPDREGRALTRAKSGTTVHVTQVRPRERGVDAAGGA